MILGIKKYGDRILQEKAKEVEKITPELKELILNMKETMRESKGVGLAAPQVGFSKRIIILETPDGVQGFINPKILKKDRRIITGEEGCLSLPGLYLKIKRYNRIEITSLDENGREINIKTEGILSRIFQHEMDHLDGKLILDRLSLLQKLKVKRRLNKKK